MNPYGVTQRAKLIHRFTYESAEVLIYHDPQYGQRVGSCEDRWFLRIERKGLRALRKTTKNRKMYEKWVREFDNRFEQEGQAKYVCPCSQCNGG